MTVSVTDQALFFAGALVMGAAVGLLLILPPVLLLKKKEEAKC